MAQEAIAGQTVETQQRRGRGRNKPFPVTSFEDSLALAQEISEHSVDGRIRRLTLMDKISASPSSSKTRDLISSAYKYGLILGSYSSEYLQLAEGGQSLLDENTSKQNAKAKQFELAIGRVESFSRLFVKLEGKRFPDMSILEDELRGLGVGETDLEKAARIFEMNLRFVGLVKDIADSEHVVTVEEAVPDSPETDQDIVLPPATDSQTDSEALAEKNSNSTLAANRPALHIDIQVHIDAESSAEQIDQIFASMARHLYGNDS